MAPIMLDVIAVSFSTKLLSVAKGCRDTAPPAACQAVAGKRFLAASNPVV
jgi:hypothetical protein